jgi:hypothetical protein|tara:strand:+ start:32 stop:619 length:588 start_codon:yes stop_codon:yes gene_type:complete
MADIHTPFSKPVMIHEMKVHEEFKKIIIPEILKKYEEKPEQKPVWSKNCNTWATKAMGLNLIQEELCSSINSWLSFFSYPYVQYKLDAWYNVHTYDMFQEIHRHMIPDAILCGVYYLQLSEKDRPITFMNLDDRYMENSRARKLEPNHPMMEDCFEPDIKEGDLILFRPDVFHLAPPAKEKHDGLRITLAFNVES